MQHFSMNIFKLPEEIFIHILYYFDRRELLCSISPVCQHFRELALDTKLWYHHTFSNNPYYQVTEEDDPSDRVLNVSLRANNHRIFHYGHVTPSANTGDPHLCLNLVAYYFEQKMIEASCSDLTQPYFIRDHALERKLTNQDRSLDIASSEKKGVLPFARHRHTMTSCVVQSDPVRYSDLPVNHLANRDIVMEGGFSNVNVAMCQAENGVYVFDSEEEQFKFRTIAGKPAKIAKHTSCFVGEDPVQNRPGMLLSVAGSIGHDSATNIVNMIDLSSGVCQEIEPSGISISPRCNHRSVLVGDELFVIAGSTDGNIPTNDVYTLNVKTMQWRKIPVKNPELFTPRLGFAMVAVGTKIIVFGGALWSQPSKYRGSWSDRYNGTFLFDTETYTWSYINTTGTVPHCIFPAYKVLGTSLYVIAGCKNFAVSPAIHILDLVSYHWRKMEHAEAYAADGLSCEHYVKRSKTDLHQFENKLLIFGGYRVVPLQSLAVFRIRWKDILERSGYQSVTYLPTMK